MKHIFVGTSGYTYKDWKGRFYPQNLPQKEWLSYYARHFKTVEINATFYGSFKSETLQHWYNQTPKDFLFSIKGSRFITHIRQLNVTREEVDRFFTQLTPLKEKLSCILWQMPGNFQYTGGNITGLENFIDLLPSDVRQCIEFRDSTWFISPVWQLLTRYNIGFVESETSEFPSVEKITADFGYIRFHGPAKLYASSYSDEELQVWAEKIKNIAQTRDVYCYFNNDYYGYAIENAKTLEQFLDAYSSGKP